MAIGPQEVFRSNVEGGLSGPANPLPDQSIDCGCGQFRLPRLVKFATRHFFVALLCCIGALQGLAQAYFYTTSPAIARTFHIDPLVIEWILIVAEITPLVFGLAVAYWGDRIHRASWTGCLVLLQCVAYICFIIPHFTHTVKRTETYYNVTHMSLYGDANPDLCLQNFSKSIAEPEEPCYFTITLFIVIQIIVGMANIAYYALGMSYVDDNTKQKHVSAYLGIVIGIKMIGAMFGYILAWCFLRLDAETLSYIESYRGQIGAWWLGWPIISFLLAIPGLMLSWFPRRLPSEMVERAAATILAPSSNIRRNEISFAKNVGSTNFFKSMLRIISNKILVFNTLSAVLCLTALINFAARENIFLESRFYVPRPTGMLLGFGDPLTSRIVTHLLKPLLIGLVLIISGIVIARCKPKTRTLVIYSCVTLVAAALVLFALSFATCQKPRIDATRRGSLTLLRYCNRKCQCSRDADFRPVCDERGTVTFYSPCHAGCKASSYQGNAMTYSDCECVEEVTGSGNHRASDGACTSDACQIGWLLFEISTTLTYALVASIVVGDLLISVRSAYVQDKALTIGFGMTFISIVAYALGKPAYDQIANHTCRYWGYREHICHLHHQENYGNYICYLTAALLLASALLKGLVLFFVKNLRIFGPIESEPEPGRELEDMTSAQADPLLGPKDEEEPEPGPSNNLNLPQIIINNPEPQAKSKVPENGPVDNVTERRDPEPTRLKYGPVGPGDRRTTAKYHVKGSRNNIATDDELDSSSDEGTPTFQKGSSPLVAYRPLEVDSDAESDLGKSSPRWGPKSTKPKIAGSTLPKTPPNRSNKAFPNPDNYGDPRILRNPSLLKNTENKPNKKIEDGDFNQVGIPVVQSYLDTMKESLSASQTLGASVTLQQLEKNRSREDLDDRFAYSSLYEKRRHDEAKRKFLQESLSPPLTERGVTFSPPRPPSRGETSSGFGSLPDVHESSATPQPKSSNIVSSDSRITKSSTAISQKKSICTDL